ncbi:hypothetical protein BpHYR1_025392 [Brachionus plicatilis]|uniref:Uncharacterized protein n=1 Tax=Brachionus plicatilis TaxID=10195 RepID=A0A3M7RH48_BRAPC|nr:hypothetical protein BpHYR1_025392 [Brachionus plicatilis]
MTLFSRQIFVQNMLLLMPIIFFKHRSKIFFLDRFVTGRYAHGQSFNGFSVCRPLHGLLKFGRPFYGQSVWWPVLERSTLSNFFLAHLVVVVV